MPTGDLLAFDEALHEDVVVEAESLLHGGLELELVTRNPNAERRAFAGRLHHHGESKGGVKLQQVFAAIHLNDVAGGRGQVVEPEYFLRPNLVHGQRGGQHPGAGIGNPEQLEHPLNAAVLAITPMQRQEGDIDP